MGNTLRRVLTVNAEHMDPHTVYKPGTYRQALSKEYIPPQTPYDKVANNYYFKRDSRRQYPVTVIVKNGQTFQCEHSSTGQLLSDGTTTTTTTTTPVTTTTTTTPSYISTVPGRPVKLQYSNAPSEYATITYYK